MNTLPYLGLDFPKYKMSFCGTKIANSFEVSTNVPALILTAFLLHGSGLDSHTVT
jgi:hypothetical protein